MRLVSVCFDDSRHLLPDGASDDGGPLGRPTTHLYPILFVRVRADRKRLFEGDGVHSGITQRKAILNVGELGSFLIAYCCQELVLTRLQ